MIDFILSLFGIGPDVDEPVATASGCFTSGCGNGGAATTSW